MSDLSNEPVTVQNLKRHIEDGRKDLEAMLSRLTPAQVGQLKDAVGWTVKDHLVHIALWQDGIRGLLQGGHPFGETMGVDGATWSQGETKINAAMQEKYQHLSPEAALDMYRKSHQQLLKVLDGLTDSDLMQPYRHYLTSSQEQAPVLGWIVGNSYGHIAEHLPWMQAIADKG